MSNLFKGIAGLIALLLMIGAILINCSSDIIVDAPLSLLGKYEGKYNITRDGRTNTYYIEMTFSDQSYWVDTTEGLCLPSGEYDFASQVNFKQLVDGLSETCDPSLNPTGLFSYRKPGDSLILTQIEDGIFKEILLVKK